MNQITSGDTNIETSARSDLTPLMRQYLEIKARYPETVLLYRMGDFYEMFNEDAKIASKVLGITLTSRNHGGAENVPLAGFPYHALDRYANRLVKAGYKIAICEQTEDPKQAKGIVKRDIVEIITAGTATEDSFIDERANNFIMSFHPDGEKVGVAVCDLSTGLFQLEEVDKSEVENEIVRTDPSEILLSDIENHPLRDIIRESSKSVVLSSYDAWKFSFENACEAIKDHFRIISVQGLGLEGFNSGVCAAGALLLYLKEQKKNDLQHISAIVPRTLSEFSELDPATIRNLELLKPLQNDDVGGTLISVLDKTSTAMGARLLRRWVVSPLKNPASITERLNCVEYFKKDAFVRGELELLLKRVSDIERLISRITFERANARDLCALKNSLMIFPRIIKALSEADVPLLKQLVQSLEGFDPIASKIDAAIVDNPPLSIREGGMIKAGVNAELDEIRNASVNGKQWIAKLQETERERTGISSLKVGFNKVFGYFIEISKSNLEGVPADYIRKQTLVNAERFITPELKEMESRILGAEERLSSLEYEIFVALRKEISSQCARIQNAAVAIATLDIFLSLGRIASEYQYCRPILTQGGDLVIKDGRHPVVERMSSVGQFIPNDLEMIKKESQILLITGPNMAGKSTFLRQNALIAIMAQMGSFVPASFAQIGIVDKFFTRVGASDRLSRGQSTFLVEMIEVANILNNATDESLILLDEVGRGTSTFDGISIAWAVAEYLHETTGKRGRTLFATHYHELAELSILYPRIKNFHVKVKEWNDQIIFLRKIDTGSCDHSYGIQVARLAGIPRKVIIRAREILANLENMELTPDHKPVLARHYEEKSRKDQLELFSGVQMNAIDSAYSELIHQIQNIDIDTLTPINALNLLCEFKKKAQGLTFH
ncbi:MAG: DNA mismatch repair protein MutS [Fibrobacter sp.]|jgi:DNA mismatch repair protein MutS|nr:DNA mismatch repair protein MutS [Fibrobacter sp.]